MQTRPAYRKPKSRRPKILGGCCCCCSSSCCCCCCCLLVGGFNPFEKNMSQNGFIFPNFRGENQKTLELPPPSCSPSSSPSSSSSKAQRHQPQPKPTEPNSTHHRVPPPAPMEIQRSFPNQNCNERYRPASQGTRSFTPRPGVNNKNSETAVLWCREKFLTTIL